MTMKAMTRISPDGGHLVSGGEVYPNADPDCRAPYKL